MERATVKTYIDQCNALDLSGAADCIEGLAAEVDRLRNAGQNNQIGRRNMDKTQLQAEVTALRLERGMRQMAEARNAELLVELAASQARERQLLDVLGELHDIVQGVIDDGVAPKGLIDGFTLQPSREVLTLPHDTSALEAMIAKAGEVMRERCSLSVLLEHGGPEDECRPALEECSEAIRTLPGVKLEDLK